MSANMTELILQHEALVRGGAFAGLLAVMALWELAAPRRKRSVPRAGRWFANFGIVAVDTVVVRLLFPIVAVGTALVAETRGWGVLNAVEVPTWLAVVISLVVLDLTIWAQHVAFHRIPVLWRLHRMHHSDVDFDVTTGFRFHPIEIALSMGIKMGLVVVLGAPGAAVVLFEVILNGMAMFNHGNVRLPAAADRLLRQVVVTPDMHRVHHSVHPSETNSNFGFNLSVWDRLFGTYRAQPRDGHPGMTIGLPIFRGRRDGRFDRLLIQPFLPAA
jgi:sterol desaturase/sphingolipid hydroxylase (fatty acid hydroxylase superfamily)